MSQSLPSRVVLDLNDMAADLASSLCELNANTRIFTFEPSNVSLAMRQLVQCALVSTDGSHIRYQENMEKWLLDQGVDKSQAQDLISDYISRIWNQFVTQYVSHSHWGEVENILTHYTLANYQLNMAELKKHTEPGFKREPMSWMI